MTILIGVSLYLYVSETKSGYKTNILKLSLSVILNRSPIKNFNKSSISNGYFFKFAPQGTSLLLYPDSEVVPAKL